ncbi:YbaK/EbsC family protein [Haladaptatus sp. AB618]|uniref:YbaK/EbsC family protein n=1 Tax=Haladaptatus sp. AB618 TaxID=2934173 RepID=UPI00209C573B|nr:YbaK/EbsC family protein [Haladaptatus sp. AB618]MCO8256265.1 YbaK/EbsC family protein [Haladaptatus sp. AB618]
MHQRAKEFETRAEERYGFDVDVHEFPEGTKTAEDAADAIGCDVAQIASSLVFRADGDLIVAVTSGANRVSEEKLAALLDVPASAVGMADAEAIREAVGWSIGGVPPFCHDAGVPVYLDETLTDFETVWAAAGTPKAVFPITPEELKTYAEATVADVSE